MLITIKSNLLPDINIETSQGSDTGDFLGRLLQPSVEVAGVEYAPYGQPAWRGAGFYILAAGLIYFLMRRL
ncbi:MAG: hypothetical protein A2X55_07765 [Nitrospirae bacterium GWB2_47_37]|nr:MAG: hypothetical protein A2X55_07765 [Nitrospirae bacterium GWB2_47_37]